tara:strand:+ start:116 stop:2689 length:2574 start_codon:yes stop_codon:yes gene_type:complete
MKQKSKPKPIKYYQMTAEQVIKQVQSSPHGLSQEQAIKRLQKLGLNKLPQEKPLSKTKLLLKQFQNPLIYILAVITIIAGFIGHYLDAIFILLVVIINTIVSFAQEFKASKALAELKKIIKNKARILRLGPDNSQQEQEVSTENLVPGDIILLEPGDMVPADARLIYANNLKINESKLTGEFWPVKKTIEPINKNLNIADQQNMVWLGSSVDQGQGKAIVIATAQNTQLGTLSLLMRETKEELSPLQKQIKKLARLLAIIIVIISVILFLIGLAKGLEIAEIFLTSTAIAVSAIPEGLLPAITIVLVIGMRRILKKKGLVRKLSATETLGSTTVICVDKTGTLTSGKMQVSQFIAKNNKLLLKAMALCNEALIDPQGKIIGNSTNKALLQASLKAGFNKNILEKSTPKTAFLPFDQEKKYLASLHKKNTMFTMRVGGAPEAIFSLCKKQKSLPEKKLKTLTSQGLRVIAFASKRMQSINPEKINWQKELTDMNFLGLTALKDPLRPQTKKAIRTCKQAGLRPIIISGDHKFTVRKIASDLNIPTNTGQIINGVSLEEMSESELLDKINDINVYTRVTPEQKLRIVSALQSQDGQIVAMTGDGVNDAPALKKADIGIALGSGTYVAKQAADLVLLQDSFSTIIKTIEQGRIIFLNIKKVVLYLLANDFSEILLIGTSILMGLPLPLLPVQILWINIIEDTLPSLALTMEPGDKNIMRQEFIQKKLFDKKMKKLLIFIALFTGLSAFALFVILLKIWGAENMNKIRSMVFAVETVDSLLFVFICARMNKGLFSKDIFKNYYLIGASIIGFLLLLFAIYMPFLQTILKTTSLSLSNWLIIALFAIIDIILIEIFKKRFIN